MKARAPGKLVLSGAYAVLDGAPALVTAVDRYAEADSARAAELVVPEIRAALGSLPAPWFDASRLRERGLKLGLGSSAAILVASLAALELELQPELEDSELAARVFSRALAAHHAAQGGGSGVDVAASAFGGTLCFSRALAAPSAEPVELPAGLSLEAFWSGEPASTAALIERVRAADTRQLLDAQGAAASATLAALRADDLTAFLAGIVRQQRVLEQLGSASGAAIVTEAAARLAALAEAEGAAALPAGAGGGDVLLYFGRGPSSAGFRSEAARSGHQRLELGFGARGVHRA